MMTPTACPNCGGIYLKKPQDPTNDHDVNHTADVNGVGVVRVCCKCNGCYPLPNA